MGLETTEGYTATLSLSGTRYTLSPHPKDRPRHGGLVPSQPGVLRLGPGRGVGPLEGGGPQGGSARSAVPGLLVEAQENAACTHTYVHTYGR